MPIETVTILGVPVAVLDRESALGEIERLYEAGAPARIAYANAHTLNLARRDPTYADLLRGADLVLNDGSGIGLAARIHGRRFAENLNGSDFNPLIVGRAAERGWPLYLLGGRDGVADKAAARLVERFPGLLIAGTQHGYFGDERAVVDSIRTTGAGVLMVAMGNPLQEQFIDRNLDATGARAGIGVGAFFDFTAGVVPRAPAWMNKVGIEWVYRLAQEPRRMWKRYVLGNPRFLASVLSERVRTRGRPASPSE